ncbi:MAG TPA: hypothetical protein VL961_06915 [Acidimicrobiales bacterium]|nr:hypothetical protein [Acidimicrobiales bacterium]
MLVLLPVLVYGVPGLLGHPILPGDDLTQSLPLRQLVGRDLSAGHVPIFDPYLWSGSPLLAGWNAGAAYPLTWLFALMSASTAWTLNVVAIGVVAGVGMFAFLRACTLGVGASFLGALTFAFGGAMSAQIQHIGLVVGMSWVPIALLAVLRLTDPTCRGRAPRLTWTAVLGLSVGLVILAGEPRAVANGAAVLVVYTAWRLLRLLRHAPPDAVRSALAVMSGAALGFGLGAVQLLPGLADVASSQRASDTIFLYSAGSLPPRWLLLFGVPDLLGGSGSYSQPHFFATYNLSEVTAYVGILPLIGAAALVVRRRWRPLPEWAVWYGVGLLGLALALATYTPLWHLFVRIPLLGGQRLQSRSIMITDLALAVLFAYWADGWLRRVVARRAELVVSLLPPLAIAAVVVVALVRRTALLGWMGGVSVATAGRESALGPWLMPFLILAVLAAVLVTAGSRLRRSHRTVAVVAFVLVDLVVYSATTVVAVGSPVPTAPTELAASTPMLSSNRSSRVLSIAALHLPGRFAIYDPALLDSGELSALGTPDANVVTGTMSIQGYGSTTDRHYAAATGTHSLSGGGQDTFDPSAAANGVFDQLDTSDVFAPSAYFAPTTHDTMEEDPGAGRRMTTAGGTASWFLGTPVDVSAATVTVQSTRPAPNRGSESDHAPDEPVRVGLLGPDGRVTWSVEVAALGTGAAGGPAGATTWRATWPRRTPAVGVEVETLVPAALGAPAVSFANGGHATLDGALQGGVTAPHWEYAGSDGAFAFYRDTRARTPLTLQPVAGRTMAGATVHRRSGPNLDPSSATVSSPHGIGVVRAVAFIPGWTATWQAAGSPTTAPLRVRRSGVVQAVTVPAGTGTVTWRYSGPGVTAGEALTAVATVAVAALLLVAAWLVSSDSRRRLMSRLGGSVSS